MSLFETGIRPAVDAHLLKLAEEKRDYQEYWSASSAGYCMRRNIFDRLKIPHVTEDARKQRVFTAGDIFHQWIQGITKESGLSIAQELELQDEDLMVKGHIDDLVLVKSMRINNDPFETSELSRSMGDYEIGHLILYDYKSQNSRAFSYQKGRPMSYFHKMQLGTYMYMIRHAVTEKLGKEFYEAYRHYGNLTEARIMKISKDDLRMSEEQLLWSDELEQEVLDYWNTLNRYWKEKKIPPCTCADKEGGFLAKEQYNPFFYQGEPCSMKWYELNKEK